MIIEKHPLPDDPTPVEAPPSYDTLPSIPSSSSYTGDAKVNPYLQPTYPPSPQSPETGSSGSLSAPVSPKGKRKGPGSKPWFPFGQAARAAREVKATVIGLVRDLVKLETPSSTAILESCSEACKVHGLSLSSILQEKAIEGHTALYWAIVKRPPETPAPNDDNDMLTGMLALAEPLTNSTISDIRLACLVASDQKLFQRLRRSPAFAPLSGSDQMLLEASVPPDEVIVEDVAGDEGAFAVHFRLVKFQARMRVSKEIKIEYIARGRIWRLSFLVSESRVWKGGKNVDKGAWLVSMTILEHSPPTWIDSLLIIEDPRSSKTSPFGPRPASPPIPRGHHDRLKPSINLRLKCGNEQLAPPLSEYSPPPELIALLEDSLMGNSLQYDGSSYIQADGALEGRLEAKLIKPEAECIIC